MSKRLMTLALACTLLSIGSIAQAGKPCPWNDKQLPEKSRICKAGTIQQCQDGQWQSTGIRCTARFRQDERAEATEVLRTPAGSRLARERVVARIAPAS